MILLLMAMYVYHLSDAYFPSHSFMMCGTPEELRERSGWLGSGEASRQQLLASLQG